MDTENTRTEGATEPSAMPRLDESQLPKPTIRERVRDCRESITWKQVAAVTGAAAAAAGGMLLVWRRRRS